MAQQNREADDVQRPNPPNYTSITEGKRSQARSQYEEGVLTPTDLEGIAPRDAIQRGFADHSNDRSPINIRNPDPAPGAMYFHTDWLTRDEAAEAAEYHPEIPKHDFYPLEVASALASLPEETLVSLGREQSPVAYLFTNRPPLAGLLKDAGNNGVVVEVVESFPQEGDGECAFAFDGRPGGEWHLVRVSWLRF